jgi:hypothetical protein
VRLQAGFLRRVGTAVLAATLALTVAVPALADDDGRTGHRSVDDASTSPLGVEWTRMVSDDLGGVEWSRAYVMDPRGVEWTGLAD